jgi:signal peptidase I
MKSNNWFESAILCAVIVATTAIAILSTVNQVSIARIASPSMEPTFNIGDTIVSIAVDRDEVRVGDILVLPVPGNKRLHFAHRVIEVEPTQRGPIIGTKGDGNPIADDWRLRITSSETRKVVAVIPTAALFQSSRTGSIASISGGFGACLLLYLKIQRSRRTSLEII